MASKVIDKVRYELCEGFSEEYRDVRDKGLGTYEMSYKGWGEFEVPTTIYFKKEIGLEPLELEHELVFEGNGKWRFVSVTIPKTLAAKLKITKE